MKFDMSAAWREATTMIAGNREVLLIVAGIFFLVPSVVMGLLIGDTQQAMFSDPEKVQQEVLALYSQWWWLFALITLATMVGNLALLALLRDHSRPTVGEAIKIGLLGLLPAIGAYLILCLGLGLGAGLLLAGAAATGSTGIAVVVTLLLIAGVVYVFVKLSLAGPVIAIDKVFNPFKILARSWQLTKGDSLRLFLFYALLFVAYIVISIVVAMVIGMLVVALGQSAALMVNAFLSGIISALAYLVLVAVLAAVHRQLSGPSATAVSETFG